MDSSYRLCGCGDHLASGRCLHSFIKTENEIGSLWNQIGAIFCGTAVAIAADHFGRLDWYFAIPLGVLAYCAIRFPVYVRHGKDAKSDKNRDEISN